MNQRVREPQVASEIAKLPKKNFGALIVTLSMLRCLINCCIILIINLKCS